MEGSYELSQLLKENRALMEQLDSLSYDSMNKTLDKLECVFNDFVPGLIELNKEQDCSFVEENNESILSFTDIAYRDAVA